MKTCPACQKTYPDDTAFCLDDGVRLAVPAAQADAQLAAGLARRYRIVRRLGRGGMGTVFLAEQIGVGNRLVALKVLNRKFLDDPDFLRRFENEAGSTGRIHHPNVVTIHESAQADDGTPYIAMEFLEGESLRDVLQRRGALPLPEVAEILQQAARGINAAHKLGIIHRDLKPDNIFLAQGGEGEVVVKVVDFGIAKLRESAMHTQTGMVLGTPAYMSSEQAFGMRSDELDARSDIYSLGVVVYEMLTGSLPFHSDTPAGFLRKHVQEQPPAFRTIAQDLDVPPQVEAAVMKALKKKREERYQSASEFAHAFVAALPAPAPGIGQPLPSTVVVASSVVSEFDAPVPLSDEEQARRDSADQPPPVLPESLRESPRAQPQESEPAAGPIRQAGVIGPPELPPAPNPPSKMKFVAIAGIALILIFAGVWYFRPSAKPAVEIPVVDKPAAEKPTIENPPPEKPPVEKPVERPSARLVPPSARDDQRYQSPSPPVTPSPSNDPIVGCYQWFNGGPVVIRTDHTVVGGPFVANWRLVNAAQRAYQLIWGQPVITKVTLSADQQTLAGGNQYGGRDAATRIAGSSGFVGTWQWLDVVASTVTVNPSGTFSAVASNAAWRGTWQAVGASPGTYALTTSDLPKDNLTLSADGSRLSGGDQYGIAISGVRTGNCSVN